MKKGLIIVVVCVLILALLGSCFGGGSSSHSTSTNKCKSCGRVFEAGDSAGNYMSIARTGMCRNCYENYQWGEQFIGR